MREKFYFFNSFLGTARELKDPELQAKYLMAIAEYGLEGKESDDPIIRALMNQTKFTLDRSEEISSSASERGKLWGRPRKSFTTSQKAKKANESYQKLTKANESEVEEEVEEEIINSSNEEFNENKNNKLNKTTSLKKIEEEKKEKSSAKKEKNAEIRERNTKILELIKQKVESLGLIYKAWEMERISATNICTAKVFGSVAEKFWLSPPELAIAVIETSAQDQFRAGKIYNAEMVYKHYEKVINQAKASFQKKQNQIAKVKRV